jgi:hypothetical protein
VSDERYKPLDAAVRSAPTDAPRAAKPRSIAIALGLLWISLAATIPQWLLDSQSGDEAWQDPTFIAVAIIAAGAGLAIGAWINIMIGRGRNWARIVNLALLCISAPLMLVFDEFATPMTPLVFAFTVFSWITNIVGTALLFVRSSNAWFRAMRASA